MKTKIRGDVEFLGTVTGITATVTTESQGDITLAVSTTGSDTPSINRPAHIVSGDYSAYPFLTIQAAIDALPTIIRYGATSTFGTVINVGAGNFDGFMVDGIAASSLLRIVGTRATATPATGPATGTATGGGVRTLTDSGATWTTDDLVGRFVRITGGTGAGQILIIAANDATNIYFADPGSPSPAAGSVYVIEDLATIINTASARAAAAGFYAPGVMFYQNSGWVELRDCKIDVGGYFGYEGSNNHRAALRRVVATGSYYGIYEQYSRETYFSQIGAFNAASYGISFYHIAECCSNTRGWLAKGCWTGIDIGGSSGTAHNGIYIRNGTGPGLNIYAAPAGPKFYDVLIDTVTTGIMAQASIFGLRRTEIRNVTTGCFYLFMTHLYIETSMIGTGNAGWGLYAIGSGNVVQITGFNPTISGASGQVTVDGTTDVTWASLASVGDYALDMATGARVNRQ